METAKPEVRATLYSPNHGKPVSLVLGEKCVVWATVSRGILADGVFATTNAIYEGTVKRVYKDSDKIEVEIREFLRGNSQLYERYPEDLVYSRVVPADEKNRLVKEVIAYEKRNDAPCPLDQAAPGR